MPRRSPLKGATYRGEVKPPWVLRVQFYEGEWVIRGRFFKRVDAEARASELAALGAATKVTKEVSE